MPVSKQHLTQLIRTNVLSVFIAERHATNHLSCLDLLRLHPPAVVLDELYEGSSGDVMGNAALHNFLADIEVNLARGASNVSKISVGHFSWPIHDAAHDRNGDTYRCKQASNSIETKAEAHTVCTNEP